MADALHTFLEKRARDDHRDLELLRPLIADAIDLEGHKEYAMAKMITEAYYLGIVEQDPIAIQVIEHQLGIRTLPLELLVDFNKAKREQSAIECSENNWIFKVQAEPYEFYVTHETVRLAGNFGLMLAGEACKKIERANPAFVRKFPDFPWTALKRLRNQHAHPARHGHNPELQQREDDAVEREVQKVEDYLNSNKPLPERYNQELLALSAGVRFYKAMCQLRDSEPEGTLIPLQGTPAMREVCCTIGVDEPMLEDAIPTMVVEHASYSLLHEINDTISKTSSFYRWRPDSALNNAQIKPMLHLRNRVAHFGGTLRMDDWQRTSEECRRFTSTILKLSSMLEEVPTADNAAKVDAFVSDLASSYESNLLGPIAPDSEKYALLNSAVERITAANLGKNKENAVVQTAALLIQRTPVERAEKVLDYAFSKLKKSPQLKIDKDCPHAVRADMRDFIHYIDIFMAPPGARAASVSM